MQPLISIIIPTYNSAHYIHKSLKSVLYRKKNIEIIIIDDSSQDKTYSIIKKITNNYDNIKIIQNNKNIGPGESRNKGIQIAKGRYILFLDSDDKIKKTGLNQLINLIKKQKKPDIFYCKFEKKTFPNNNDKILTILKQSNNNNFFLNTILKKQFPVDECWPFVINLNFLKKNNIYFPKGIHVAEDELFILKILSFMKSYKVIDNKYYYHSERSGSLSSDLSNFKSTKDFINLMFIFLDFASEKKFNKIKKAFIKKYIITLYERISLLSLIRTETEIKKIIKYFKKNNKNFFLQSLKNLELLNLKDIIYLDNLNKMNAFKLKVIRNIYQNFNSNTNIFIYCKGLISRAVIKVAKKYDLNVIGVIDDNIDHMGSFIEKVPIINYVLL